MKDSRRTVKFRRRREALTDYKKRLALAKSGFDRVVIRKTNRRILGQIVRYKEKGDAVLAQVDSDELKKFGWPSRSNRPTAYLTGMLLAKKAIKISEIEKSSEAESNLILDIGLSSPVKGSIPFVFAKGLIDAGLKVRSGFKIEEGIYNYSNISYAKQLKEKDVERYNKQYSLYIKNNVALESINKLFKETKEKIMKEN